MIDLLSIIQRVVKVISDDARHEYYNKTVKLATELKALITGEGIDDLMKQFNMRETTEQFEQRKRLTQHITTSIAKTIMDVSYKVPRSNAMRRILTAEEKVLEEFNNILNKFWGAHSWDDYMATRFIEMNYIDPNAFLVFEFDEFNEKEERLQPFPFEVKSEEAVDYFYKNKVLLYLIVMTNQNTFLNQEGIKRYTLYSKNVTINFDYFDEKEEKETDDEFKFRISQKYFGLSEENNIVFENEEALTKDDASIGYLLINNSVYKIDKLKNHNLDFVPAIQYGYVPDLATDRKTFRNPFDAAIPYLKKLIKVVSEMDLSMSLHAMPQKITYQNRCTDCNGSGQKPEGKCPKCKGMGYQIVTSAQDSMTIKLPHDVTNDKIIDLEKLVRYIYPPVEGLQFQWQYIKDNIVECFRAVYGNQAVRKDQVTTTATESLLDLSKTYDALHPFTKKYSKTWMFGIKTTSSLTELKVTYSMSFSKDLKFLDKADYFDLLEKAQKSNAHPMIKKTINYEIIKLDYAENPDMLNKIIVQDYFLPFQNLDRDERLAVVSSRPREDYERVLFESFSSIFSQLEQENDSFYTIGRKEQISLVKDKVTEFIEEIKKNEPTLNLNE